MTSFNKLNRILENEGFKVQKRFYKWGVEFIAEKDGCIYTINVYRNGDNTILLEASSLSNYSDATVDIRECSCSDGDLDSCIKEILTFINEMLLA
jgi:hypothetical protein